MFYKDLFVSISQNPRYLGNLDWGKPRRGHPEGTVRAHIQELEQNLETIGPGEGEEDYWKLMLLIHVHDSFKKDSKKGVAIEHPDSHASLARRFLSEYCKDEDLLNMVQYHDEPYALYRQDRLKGRFNTGRLDKLKATISDWPLFLRFMLIDGYTDGKSAEPLDWSIQHLASSAGLSEQMKGWLKILVQGSKVRRCVCVETTPAS